MSARTQIDQVVSKYVSQGYSIKEETDNYIIVYKGRQVNHLLHVILIYLTLFSWLIVYLPFWAFVGAVETRVFLDGNKKVIEKKLNLSRRDRIKIILALVVLLNVIPWLIL